MQADIEHKQMLTAARAIQGDVDQNEAQRLHQTLQIHSEAARCNNETAQRLLLTTSCRLTSMLTCRMTQHKQAMLLTQLASCCDQNEADSNETAPARSERHDDQLQTNMLMQTLLLTLLHKLLRTKLHSLAIQ